MKKATAVEKSSSALSVKVGRFNEETEELELKKGATIQDAIDKLDMSISSSESLWVNGEEADMDDEIEDGDYIQVVGKKEGGNEEDEDEDEDEEDEDDENEEPLKEESKDEGATTPDTE